MMDRSERVRSFARRVKYRDNANASVARAVDHDVWGTGDDQLGGIRYAARVSHQGMLTEMLSGSDDTLDHRHAR